MLSRRSILMTSPARLAGRSTTCTTGTTTSVGPGVRIRPARSRLHRNQMDLTEDNDPRNPGDRGVSRPSIRSGDHTRRNACLVI